MELFASLMKGYTPILIFIFLCFASLLVMFMKLLRSLEDMLNGLSGDRNALVQQLSQIKEQLELIARQQAEGGSLRRTGGAPEVGAGYGPSAPPPATELGAGFSPAQGQVTAFPSEPLPAGSTLVDFSRDVEPGKGAGAWGAAGAAVAGAAIGVAVARGAAGAGSEVDKSSPATVKKQDISLEEAEQAATEELVFSMDERMPPPRPASPAAKPAAPEIEEFDLGDADLAETLDLSQFTANDEELSFIGESAVSESDNEAEQPETLDEEELQLDFGIEPAHGLAREEEEIDLLGLEDEAPRKSGAQADALAFDTDLLLDDTMVEGISGPSPQPAGKVQAPKAPAPAKESAFSLDEIAFEDSSDNIDIDLSSTDDKELDLLVEDLVDVPEETGKDRATAADDEAPYEEAEVILDDEEPETELDILLDAPDEQGGPAGMDDELDFNLDLDSDEAPRHSGVKNLQLENLELLSEHDLGGEPFAMNKPAAAAASAAKPAAKPAAPPQDEDDEIDLLDFTMDDLSVPSPAPAAGQGAAKKQGGKESKGGKDSNLVDFILDE
jgi:hypothetical protein